MAIMALPVLLPFVTIIRESMVRWEMMEALEEKELINILVDEKDILWEEAGKECRIYGRLFDIKEFEKINDQYALKGLYDDREKEIEEQLAKMTGNKNKEQSNMIAKLLNLRYLNKENIDIPARHYITVNRRFILYNSNDYHLPYLSITSPPPEES
jgi:hypothetical protein